ncbi:hypothetical protein D3C79_954430 [compost metagenome]
MFALRYAAARRGSHQIVNHRLCYHPLVVAQGPIVRQLLLIRRPTVNGLVHMLNKGIALQKANLLLKLGGCQQGCD